MKKIIWGMACLFLLIIIFLYAIYYVGWPPNLCDLIFTQSSQAECYWNKIYNSSSPDIRLCYKRVFNNSPIYNSYFCTLTTAEKTKDYSICENSYRFTKDAILEWLCIGTVSKERKDDNECNAPNDQLKGYCQEMQRGIYPFPVMGGNF